MTGSPAAALTLFVLVVIMALGAATFFRRKLAALSALLALPIALVLKSAVGGRYTVLLFAAAGILVALLHTISDTFTLLQAGGSEPRPRQTSARQRARARSERTRIAA